MFKEIMKSNNKMIYGVCDGIANYLEIDVTFLRLLWCSAILLRGIGGILYLICALLMPEYNKEYDINVEFNK